MEGPTAGAPNGPGRFVTADNVRAAFGFAAALREVGHDDPDASWMVFELEDGRFVEVFVNSFPVGPDESAIEDEEAWRASGVASEVADVGDAAFFNRDGALFAVSAAAGAC
ncbi:MAG: hypothetical protein ACRD0U_04865 [Acidimicrobiales bacterium]